MTIADVVSKSQKYCNQLFLRSCPICHKKVKIIVGFDMVYSVEIKCGCGLKMGGDVTRISEYPDAFEAINRINKTADNLKDKWNKRKEDQ